MSSTTKTLVLRFVRGLAYTAVAAAVSFTTAHYADISTVVPASVSPLVAGVLLALDKFVRDGGDAYE